MHCSEATEKRSRRNHSASATVSKWTDHLLSLYTDARKRWTAGACTSYNDRLDIWWRHHFLSGASRAGEEARTLEDDEEGSRRQSSLSARYWRRRLLLHTHARPTEWRVLTYSNRLQQPQHGDYRSASTTNLRPRCSSLRPTFSRTLTTINGRLKPCFYIDHPCTGHLRIVRKSFLRATP